MHARSIFCNVHAERVAFATSVFIFYSILKMLREFVDEPLFIYLLIFFREVMAFVIPVTSSIEKLFLVLIPPTLYKLLHPRSSPPHH